MKGFWGFLADELVLREKRASAHSLLAVNGDKVFDGVQSSLALQIAVAIEIFERARRSKFLLLRRLAGSKVKSLASGGGNVLLKSHNRAVQLRIEVQSPIRLSASFLSLERQILLEELLSQGFSSLWTPSPVRLLHRLIKDRRREVFRVFVSNNIGYVSLILVCIAISPAAAAFAFINPTGFHH